MDRVIKQRNVFLMYVFALCTFGLYFFYWTVATKRDINSRGGEIPTTWILLIPFAALYYSYKYCEGFATKIKKDNNTWLYFALHFFVGFVMPAIVQSELNKHAGSPTHTPHQHHHAA